MDCPECGVFNTPDAKRCQCGFDLASPSARHAGMEAAAARRAAPRIVLGLVVAVLGAWRAFAAWDDWSFARAASSLGLSESSPLPLSLIVWLAVTAAGALAAWRAWRSLHAPR
jgi:hypothetical protein